MTNSPDPTNPASDSATGTDPAVDSPASTPGAAAAPSAGVPAAPASVNDAPAFDAGTYSAILEPRHPGRLPLGDGTWHQVAKKYVTVQFIANAAVLLLIVAVVVALYLFADQTWAWIPGAIAAAVTVVTMIVLPRQARSIGYQLRKDDLVFRRGILWQRMVAVPYGRMQLVDITHGPLDRGFGIAQLKLVTAAASTGVTIPGLTQAAAEQLRDTLIDVAETRRTGL
ncbi:PH domain-containing protein [Microbacterium sp. MC2]